MGHLGFGMGSRFRALDGGGGESGVRKMLVGVREGR